MPDPLIVSDADFLRFLAIRDDHGIPEIRETNERIKRIAASLESRSAESVEPRAESGALEADNQTES